MALEQGVVWVWWGSEQESKAWHAKIGGETVAGGLDWIVSRITEDGWEIITVVPMATRGLTVGVGLEFNPASSSSVTSLAFFVKRQG